MFMRITYKDCENILKKEYIFKREIFEKSFQKTGYDQ